MKERKDIEEMKRWIAELGRRMEGQGVEDKDKLRRVAKRVFWRIQQATDKGAEFYFTDEPEMIRDLTSEGWMVVFSWKMEVMFCKIPK